MRTLALSFAVLATLVLTTAATASNSNNSPGAVYTLTNSSAGNAVAAFSRAADGTLVPQGTFATGGSGTGAGLGSQGAIVLSNDNRQLFAVNAGSNSISLFTVAAGRPRPRGNGFVGRVDTDQRDGARQAALRAERQRQRQHHRLHGRR